MTISNFFVMCPEEGFQVFETLDEALDAADERIKCYLSDCWSEDVTGVCVGNITHRAKMCDQVYPDGEIDEEGIDEAGDYWESDCECKCNYKMMPVEPENPADDVTKLVEALEGLLGVIDESRGYHLNEEIAEWDEFQEVHDATAALAAYRKQGGEL